MIGIPNVLIFFANGWETMTLRQIKCFQPIYTIGKIFLTIGNVVNGVLG